MKQIAVWWRRLHWRGEYVVGISVHDNVAQCWQYVFVNWEDANLLYERLGEFLKQKRPTSS